MSNVYLKVGINVIIIKYAAVSLTGYGEKCRVPTEL